MNLLAIVGSPRKGRATDTLVDKGIEGAKSKHTNCTVKKIHLMDYDIQFCKNCLACRDTKTDQPFAKCTIQDGGASGWITVQGTGRIGKLNLETPAMIRFGAETTVRVLHPLPEGVRGNDNANSVVLLIEYAGRRLLLTGDLLGDGLDQLLAGQVDRDLAIDNTVIKPDA